MAVADPNFEHFLRAVQHVATEREIRVTIIYKPSVVLNVGGAATVGAVFGGPLGFGIGAVAGFILDQVSRNERVIALATYITELAQTAKERLFAFLRQLFRDIIQTIENVFETAIRFIEQNFDRFINAMLTFFNETNGNTNEYQITYQ